MNTFKWATNDTSEMNYTDFLNAVDKLQEQLKMETKTLVNDVLKVQNEATYRNRINNMKIQYFGPSKNFFAEALVKE